MNTSILFLVMNQSCNQAVEWVDQKLQSAGLRMLRTFDLKGARTTHLDCPCPHHGTDQCDCQMVVLLVYSGNRQPVSLIAQGRGDQTWFYVVNTPQQRPDPRVETSIRQALIPPVMITNREDHAHAV
jgi:hypothetical protein